MKTTILAILLTFIGLSSTQAKQRPNVLFIPIDDLKPALGCYGDQKAITPNIDRLTAQGVTFLNNHCQLSLCGPSRNSIMTGVRPDSGKVLFFGHQMRKQNPGVITIPEHFKNNGYETVGLGKVYDLRNVKRVQDPPSWTRKFFQANAKKAYFGYAEPQLVAKLKKQGEDANAQGAKTWGQIAKYLDRPSTECTDVSDETYKDGILANKGVELLKELSQQEKSFFLAVGLWKPHLPFIAPKKYWNLYKREEFSLASYREKIKNGTEYTYHNSGELRTYADIPKEGPLNEEKQLELIHGYYACVSYIDALVGKLIDQVEKLGIADNTIIVLWGDHGFHLGDHGLWCKFTNLEEGTRFPLIISAPDANVKRGSKI